MVGHRHIGGRYTIARPFLEAWVHRRELLPVIPGRLQNSIDQLIGRPLVGGKVDVVNKPTSVLHDGGGASPFCKPPIIAPPRLPHAPLTCAEQCTERGRTPTAASASLIFAMFSAPAVTSARP